MGYNLYNYITCSNDTDLIATLTLIFDGAWVWGRGLNLPCQCPDRCKESSRFPVAVVYRRGWRPGRARFRECWRSGCRRWTFSGCRRSGDPPPHQSQWRQSCRPAKSCQQPTQDHLDNLFRHFGRQKQHQIHIEPSLTYYRSVINRKHEFMQKGKLYRIFPY